jgi:hypothetical protein
MDGHFVEVVSQVERAVVDAFGLALKLALRLTQQVVTARLPVQLGQSATFDGIGDHHPSPKLRVASRWRLHSKTKALQHDGGLDWAR